MSRPQASADVFTAIADPTRRLILHRLGAGEQPVTALARTCTKSMSALSQQLRVLQEAGLVSVRQVGRERYYRLNPEPLRTVAEWVSYYEPFWFRKLEALAAYLDESLAEGADEPLTDALREVEDADTCGAERGEIE
jgi:DNA-binding transcriptional ArsR family regulator